MLPQMMPLPWLMVYFTIFFVFCLVLLWISYFYFSYLVSSKRVKYSSLSFVW